jgi:hypothetical protein
LIIVSYAEFTDVQMVARGSRSKVESTDLHLALFALDKWFGYTNSPFGNIFHLYKPFNNTEDLLFRVRHNIMKDLV